MINSGALAKLPLDTVGIDAGDCAALLLEALRRIPDGVVPTTVVDAFVGAVNASSTSASIVRLARLVGALPAANRAALGDVLRVGAAVAQNSASSEMDVDAVARALAPALLRHAAATTTVLDADIAGQRLIMFSFARELTILRTTQKTQSFAYY